jgi:hypothetical protein
MKWFLYYKAALLTALAALLVLGSAASAGAGVAEKNDLKQLATFYQLFDAEFGRGPKALPEFLHYIKRDAPKLHKALTDGRYVLVLTRKPSSKAVLVYEKKPDRKGVHTVAMGDASVSTLTTKQLRANLKKAE